MTVKPTEEMEGEASPQSALEIGRGTLYSQGRFSLNGILCQKFQDLYLSPSSSLKSAGL